MNAFDLVAKLTLDSSDYENGLNNAENKANSFGGGIAKGLGVVGSAVTAAVGAATTAVVGFSKESVEVGRNFDASMSQVAATMGLTMDDMQTVTGETDTAFGHFSGTLREFAQYMGKNTAFSASQAADALNYMALAGYDAQTSMDMLPNVLNLAAAGGMELASASDMVTDASSALGLSIDDTSALVDKMAKASSKSNTSVQQLGEAILTVGGTAKDMAGGTTEIAAALGILADNGTKGAEGGTALRNVLLGIQSKKFNETFGELGVSAYDANGELRPLSDTLADMNKIMDGMTTEQKNKLITDTFNRADLKNINALLATSTERWDSLSQAIDGAWYTTDSLSKSLSSSALPSLQQMQTNLESLGISAEDFGWALDVSGGDAEVFAEALLNASDNAISIEEVTQALGGDLDALGVAFEKTSGAAQAMADTQLDNLEGDITKFQSALEGAQLVISDKLSPSIREFVQFATDGLGQVVDAFNEGGLSGAMSAFGEVLSQGLQMIVSMIPQMVQAGMELLSALGQGIMQNLPMLLETAMQVVMMLAQYFISALPQLRQAGIETLLILAQGITEAIPQLLPTAIDVIIQLVEMMISNVDKMVDAAVEIILALANAIIDNLPTLLEKAPEIIGELVAAIIENTPKLLDAAVEIIVRLAEFIVQNLPKIVEVGTQIVIQLASGIVSVISEVESAARQVIDKVVSVIKSVDPVQWGKDLISGFANGIRSGMSWVTSAIGNVTGYISSHIGFSEPDEGPLKNFHTYAPDMMQLFAQGIRENLPLITDALDSVTEEVNNGFKMEPSIPTTASSDQTHGVTYTGPINININGYNKDSKELARDIQRIFLMDERQRRNAFA